MTTYSIVASTNSWIANRDPRFNGKCEYTMVSGLSLREAQKNLLKLYNQCFEDERAYAPNWGIAVLQSSNSCDGARKTFSDGTRCFYWDSRYYSIEIETEE